jgi:serine protein kinase
MKSNPLHWVDESVHKSFDSTKALLSFEEYLQILSKDPERQLRGSAGYAADMMDFFGKKGDAYRVFDEVPSSRKVIGHESVQREVYRALRTFERQGFNNKLILLHGPNGSAKSSLVQALMAGLERYSHSPEGAQYTFNWVFPIEKIVRGSLGLQSSGSSRGAQDMGSYAKLSDDEVAARIPSELKDHPLLLIPLEQRKEFLKKLLGDEKGEKLWQSLPLIITQGDLNHRCKEISNALLKSYDGDFKKVLMHVQVERLFHSRRYRKNLVTIEPQLHVDAQYGLLTMNRSLSQLPVSLQSLNLFSVSGDLIDGNRGVIEYNDLLKRPLDSFKYLLVACETGNVNVGQTIVYLDTLFMGSCNELQLDAFKEFPDFTSFKARMELIKVPYLLSISQEKSIYQEELRQISLTKSVAPHTDWTIASWAVLTRLKKPNSMHYAPGMSAIVANLTPLEKAKLYDRSLTDKTGTPEMPQGLTNEDRKVLKAHLSKLGEEYQNSPMYEGRLGASAREMKGILFSAAQNPDFTCLTPLAVLRELEDFVKRVSEYDYLKQDPRDGYHDNIEFIATIRNEYLNTIDREIRDSIGLYDSRQWEDFIRKYVQHVSLVLKKERHKNPHTGQLEDPDHSLVAEFERIIDAPQTDQELWSFRNNLISQIGAWSLDHPQEAVVYSRVFPEYWKKLEKFYYQTQKSQLTKMHNALLLYRREGDVRTKEDSLSEEGNRLATQTIANMKTRYGYTEESAREVITFLMKSRYSQ